MAVHDRTRLIGRVQKRADVQDFSCMLALFLMRNVSRTFFFGYVVAYKTAKQNANKARDGVFYHRKIIIKA